MINIYTIKAKLKGKNKRQKKLNAIKAQNRQTHTHKKGRRRVEALYA